MRPLFAFAALAAAFAAPLPAQENTAHLPDPVLITAQHDVDAGRLTEAESTVRDYLTTHDDSADGRYLLAYILLKASKVRASLDEYARANRLRPPSALDLAAMASDHFLLEEFAEADRLLTSALTLEPKNYAALYLLGRTKYNEQRFDEALPLWQECIRLDPSNVLAANYLGLTSERLGQTDEAERAYRLAIAGDSNPPKNAEPRLNLGNLLVESGKPAEALPILAAAAALAPGDPQIHRASGKALLRTGQLEQAQTELETAVRLAPQNAPGHFLLSEVYSKRGLLDQARQETQTYADLTRQKSSPVDMLAEARTLVERSRFDEAEGTVRRYLETHRASADAHYLLGYVLFKQRRAKESLAEYTEGAQYRKPGSADLEAVGGDYVLLHDYPDADKWFSVVTQMEPANFQARYLLGRSKYSENRFDEAVTVFLECLKLDPHNVDAEDNLGLSYEGLGRTDEALAAYRQAISWQGNAGKEANPYIDLGSLLVSTSQSAGAIEPLLKAVELAPAEMRAHRELGKAYAHLGQLEKAQQEFERAVQLAPGVASPHYLLAQVYKRRGLDQKAQAESDRYRELTRTHSSDNEGGMAGRKSDDQQPER